MKENVSGCFFSEHSVFTGSWSKILNQKFQGQERSKNDEYGLFGLA